MAGHSKFKNIMHRKGAQDAKRAKKFTKLIREITTATRLGQPDPGFNPRLRSAIATARAANLPKDRIDNAIKKGAMNAEGENFDETRYECYAFDGSALIIDCLTDNRNRTVSDIKSIINKAGATPAEPGSVIFMFDRMGYLMYQNDISDDQMFEYAVEAGAEECISSEGSHEIYTSVESLNKVQEYLEEKIGLATESKLTWKEKNAVEIKNKETAEKLLRLIDNLEDNDDVQSVSGNYEIPEEIIKELAAE